MQTLLVALALFSIANAQNLPQVASPPAVKAYVENQAKDEGLSPELISNIVNCESGYVPQQSKFVRNGIREDSWGIWQIHLPSHKDITREQAMDIIWSTNWAIQQIKAGKIKMWSCYSNFD